MPQNHMMYEHEDDLGLIDVRIDYCFSPGCPEIRDPERPEPAEDPLIEIEAVTPPVLSDEQALDIVGDFIRDNG